MSRNRAANRVTGTLAYEVRRARDDSEMEAALQLRYEVFCVEQGVPRREELDGRDSEGIHLVAIANGELVGTCRLAVDRGARRRRIATALLETADAETLAAGGRRVILHAQTYARKLYEGCGYRPRGRKFWEAGIEHIAMEKHLD